MVTWSRTTDHTKLDHYPIVLRRFRDRRAVLFIPNVAQRVLSVSMLMQLCLERKEVVGLLA